MKIPSLKEIEEYAMLYAENKPRPTAIVDGFTECYNKFIKPMQQANGDEQSSSNCNIPLVSGRVCFSPDCFYHDKTTDTCVGDYAKCTVKQTHR